MLTSQQSLLSHFWVTFVVSEFGVCSCRPTHHWETKGRFRKRVVLANVPSFQLSFRGNVRMYPRSGFRSGGNIRMYPRSGFSFRGNILQNHPFRKPPCCQPPVCGLKDLHQTCGWKSAGACVIPYVWRSSMQELCTVGTVQMLNHGPCVTCAKQEGPGLAWNRLHDLLRGASGLCIASGKLEQLCCLCEKVFE